MSAFAGIRLLASDYDGTLASRGMVVPEVVATLRGAIGPNRMFAIVTGRPFAEFLDVIQAAGLIPTLYPQALVCDERDVYLFHNGAYQPLQPHNENAYKREAALLPYTRGLVRQLECAWPNLLKQLGISLDEDQGIRQSTPEAEERRGYVELRFGNSNIARTAQSFVEEKAADNPEFMAVRNGQLVSLRCSAFGKGATLDLLRRHFGLHAEQIMAVGDSGNDLSMLDGRFGFRSAAVGNADPEVKHAVNANSGVILTGHAGAGIQELLELCS